MINLPTEQKAAENKSLLTFYNLGAISDKNPSSNYWLFLIYSKRLEKFLSNKLNS